MPAKTVQIKQPLWGGRAIFHYGKNEPWVGVAIDKIKDSKEVALLLSFKRDKPVYLVKTGEFVDYALEHGWTNINGGYECAYMPISKLAEMATAEENKG